ncbi:site-specific integrase, partial [bacterium]|nr:site-specific integrase [bacterium]
MKKNYSLSQLVADFLDYLEIEKNRSPLTIRNYHHYLGELVEFLERRLHHSPTLSDLTLENIRRFRKYLAEKKDPQGNFLKKVTQGYYMIALRSFLRWLAKNDYPVLSPEKIDLPKPEARPIKFLTAEEVERLLSQPSISSRIGLRDKAILELLFSTGLRVSELVSLNRDQINLKSSELGIIGKGR